MIRRAFLARMAFVAIALGVVRYEMPEIEEEWSTLDFMETNNPRWNGYAGARFTEDDIRALAAQIAALR